MRTGKQGQAAVSRERVYRRRKFALPGAEFLGHRRISCGLSRMQWSAIQRFPALSGMSGFCHGRFTRTWLFLCFLRNQRFVCDLKTKNGGKTK